MEERYATKADTPDQAVVFNSRDRLEKTLNRLGENLGALTGRLQPVLSPQEQRPEKSIGAEPKVVASASPLTRQLTSLNTQANQLNANIEDILRRLEI